MTESKNLENMTLKFDKHVEIEKHMKFLKEIFIAELSIK